MKNRSSLVFTLILAVMTVCLVSCGSNKSNPSSPSAPSGPSGTPILYIYSSNTTPAGNFTTFLNANGYNVTTMTMTNAATANLSGYSAILISDDSSASYPWGGATFAALVTSIKNSAKPVIALGEGGSYFLESIGTNIGYNNSGYDNGNSVNAVNPSDILWTSPNVVAPTTGAVLYTGTPTFYCPYFAGAIPAHAVMEAVCASAANYYPLAYYNAGGPTYFAWGYQSDSSTMTVNGQNLFLNILKNIQNTYPLLINYPQAAGAGAGNNISTDKMDIVSYPGSALNSLVMYLTATVAGTYTYSVSVADDCTAATSSTSGSVVMDGVLTHNFPVTFSFAGNPSLTQGSTVQMVFSQASGPAATTYFCINGNYSGLTGSSIGVNDLNGTPCPYTFRGYGYAILLYGTP